MNSARPNVGPGLLPAPATMASRPVSGSTTRRAPSQTYATRWPAGSGRGSSAGDRAPTCRGPVSAWSERLATYTCPASANAAMVRPVSVANATMPPACSRVRSRRAFSGAGTSPSVAFRVAGSATSRSFPLPTSSTHRQFSGSVPPWLRRKATRLPSGEIWNERGAPRVNRCVRACCRGKLSVMPRSCHRPPTVYRARALGG